VTCTKRFLTLLLFLLSGQIFAQVGVLTYNLAQLKRYGLDFVPCTDERLTLQLKALFDSADSPLLKTPHFILTLQEVFTPEAFRALKARAKELGLEFHPNHERLVVDNGLVTISNLPVRERHFHPFSVDTYAKKGILYTVHQLGKELIAVANVHTGYSTTQMVNQNHMRQIAEVARFAEDSQKKVSHLVIAGDFNAGPDMSYTVESYPMAKTLWHEGLIPQLSKQGMRWVDYQGVTWDNDNYLINNPSWIIQVSNLFIHGMTSWGLSSSKMDHVFLSRNLKDESASIVLEQDAPMRCWGRDQMKLSDHYGLWVKVSVLTPTR
jgi:endonuclease/exonuclease/phosphatase family metal-dependent hydrolase